MSQKKFRLRRLYSFQQPDATTVSRTEVDRWSKHGLGHLLNPMDIKTKRMELRLPSVAQFWCNRVQRLAARKVIHFRYLLGRGLVVDRQLSGNDVVTLDNAQKSCNSQTLEVMFCFQYASRLPSGEGIAQPTRFSVSSKSGVTFPCRSTFTIPATSFEARALIHKLFPSGFQSTP